MIRSVWANRSLLWLLVRRDVAGRYRGANLGFVWSLINPLLMLSVFTFVFSVVFRVKWGVETQSKYEFAIVLYVGMIIHGFVAECLNRSPAVILESPAYVTKVSFPLELLPVVVVGSAFFHLLINVLVLLGVMLVAQGELQWTVPLFFATVLPAFLGTLGVSCMLASLGVFVRDVGQITGSLAMVLLFLSPVFYPPSSLPEQFRFILEFNPLTYVIQSARDVLIWGNGLNWLSWFNQMVGSLLTLFVGYAWFARTRAGFADVV